MIWGVLFLSASLRAAQTPEQVVGAALFALTRLGCDETSALERRAKSFGVRPKPEDERLAGWAVAALGRSMPVDAARALWRVFDFFPKGSPGRLRALEALLKQKENL